MSTVSKPRRALALIVICALLLGVWIYWGTQKIDYHMDEFYSYVQSNCAESENYTFPENQLLSPSIIEEYAAAQHGSLFNPLVPYKNLVKRGATHPPLYHTLLHMACSFTPGVFSPWSGLILNYALLILTVLSVFLLSRELFRDERIALFSCLCFGLMSGVTAMAEFIRMYCLLMLWCTLTAYLHIRALRQEQPGRRLYIAMAVCTLLGALTHYYFLVFMFFMAAAYVICRWKQGNKRALIGYIKVMAICGVLFALLYPWSFKQFIGRGGRGSDAYDMVRTFSVSAFLTNLGEFVRVALDALSPFRPLAVILSVLGLVGLALAFRNGDRPLRQALAVFFCCSLCYFLVVVLIAPLRTLRYLTPVLPIAAAVLPGALALGFGALFKRLRFSKPVGAAALAAVLGIGLMVPPFTCYWENRPVHELYRSYSDLSALYVYPPKNYRPGAHFVSLQQLSGFMINPSDSLETVNYPALGDKFLVLTDGKCQETDQLAAQIAGLSGHASAADLGPVLSGHLYLIQ